MKSIAAAACCALLALWLRPASSEAPERIAFPEVTMSDHRGERIAFGAKDRGRITVVSFMYSSCETLCPVTNAILSALDSKLDTLGTQDVRILSISIDPANDRPALLARTAARFQASERWHFASGPAGPVLARRFGVDVRRLAFHDPIIFVGRADQRLFVRRFGQPDPEALLAAIEQFREP